MKNVPKRIWTGTGRGGGEWRELHKVGQNDNGDILLTLDGGEVWQFTPKHGGLPAPRRDEVESICHGVCRSWIAQSDCLGLKDKSEYEMGTIRMFKPDDDVALAAMRGAKAGLHEGFRERDKKQRKDGDRIRKGQYDADNWNDAWAEVRRLMKTPEARIGEVLAQVRKSKCMTKVSFDRFRRKWYADQKPARNQGGVK